MTEQINILGKIENFVDGIESTAVDLVARLSPWLAPLPTAYLTARATVAHLGWPEPMGAVAGVIIESLGLGAVSTALELREYNATRRKSDPQAPFGLAAVLTGVYFASVTALTVALDTLPDLATYAPLVFPILSLAGVTVLAIRADHRRRLAAIETVKAERKARRKGGRQAGVKPTVQNVSGLDVSEHKLDAANAARANNKVAILERLVDILVNSPGTGVTDLARQVGRSRTTIYGYLAELETAGRISKDNGAVKVLEV